MFKYLSIIVLSLFSLSSSASDLTTKEICKNKLYKSYSATAKQHFKTVCNAPPYKAHTLKEYDNYYKELAEMTLLCKHEVETTKSMKGNGCFLMAKIDLYGWSSGLVEWEIENKPVLSPEAQANKKIAFDPNTTFQFSIVKANEDAAKYKSEHDALPFWKRWTTPATLSEAEGY